MRLAAVALGLLVALSGCSVDASRAQTKDCVAALKVVARRTEGVITSRPRLCDPLTERQYKIAMQDATRKYRARAGG